jgi:hypothetical protein
MITKTTIIGLLSIMDDYRFQVRTDTVISEDGTELSRTYHRVVLEPGDDVSTQPKLVQDVAGLLWTPEVVSDWQVKAAAMRIPTPIPPAN